MERMDREKRKAILKQRQEQEAEKRNDSNFGGLNIFDFSEYEEVPFYKLKEGENRINVIPYIIQSKNHPSPRDIMPIGCEDYKLDIWIHKNVGIKKNTVVCLLETYGKACPICEDRERLLEENGRDYKDKKVKDLSPQRRCYYNVEDDLDLDKGIQILDQSHFKFEKEVYEKAMYLNPGFTKFADLDEGFTIKFRGVKGKFDGREFIEPKDFEFIEREAYDEAVLDEVFLLDKMLNVLTYEEIEKLHYHLEGDGSDDEQEPEQKQERKSKYKKEQEQAREEEIQEEVEDPECPYDHQIGIEHNQTTDCDECLDDNQETFKLCRKLQKEFETTRGKPKEEQKKQQPAKRTPRRNKNR